MPNLHVPELLVILVIFLLIFGAGKLPDVAGALGKGIREFRRGQSGLIEEVAAKDRERDEPDG